MDFFETTAVKEVSVKETSFIKEIDVESMDKPYNMEENIEKRELTLEQKMEIQKETKWSNEMVDAMSSMEEYQIYKDARLVETQIGEKVCLIRSDIDMEQTDGFGRTNKERMEQGLAPLTSEERPYELHHIGQHQDSPLAELTMQEHRGKDNCIILHRMTKESEIDREEFGIERAKHWQNRAEVENE